MVMKTNLKYSVLPLEEYFASEPIFVTPSLPEALERVKQEYDETQTRCIIVSCRDGVEN